ncbi:hypothetical protein Ade02nite_42180 [Paractinoplanes deccanensis]|uniref:Uncharacterized protein n=1 Tax=Paractinoplanes deccanensis TaxID=113561 RepID=A0ABQ3Y6H3_9ACTN|nr:hypothetical protein [Actinoplanes deccanensis]GID75577.1 hypothetical protein Ade02nite_42180 [Actinoplanes deccanensis]
MIYASTRLHETAGAKVFVDTTGRRKRLLVMSGVFAALAAAVYIGVVAMSFAQAPKADLPTKGTISTPTKAATAASER